MQSDYGGFTGYAIGVLMLEMVRRAIKFIRDRRDSFQYVSMPGDSSVTDVDMAIQEMYVEMIQKTFPGAGIVAEENSFRIVPRSDVGDMWFTIDGLDGTASLVRGSSNGIGTTLALVLNGKAIAVYIGNVMTGEIFGFRPDSNGVERIEKDGSVKRLTPIRGHSLSRLWLLLRKSPHKYAGLMKSLIPGYGSPFNDMNLVRGSIGLAVTSLLVRDSDAAILSFKKECPWDDVPALALCQRSGFAVWEVDQSKGEFVKRSIVFSKGGFLADADLLVLPEGFSSDFQEWQASRNTP